MHIWSALCTKLYVDSMLSFSVVKLEQSVRLKSLTTNNLSYRLLTGSILAHEMMHAWMRLSGVFLYTYSMYSDYNINDSALYFTIITSEHLNLTTSLRITMI